MKVFMIRFNRNFHLFIVFVCCMSDVCLYRLFPSYVCCCFCSCCEYWCYSFEVLSSIATNRNYNGGAIVKSILWPDNCNMEEV